MKVTKIEPTNWLFKDQWKKKEELKKNKQEQKKKLKIDVEKNIKKQDSRFIGWA